MDMRLRSHIAERTLNNMLLCFLPAELSVHVCVWACVFMHVGVCEYM